MNENNSFLEESLLFLKQNKVDGEIFSLSSGEHILIQKYFVNFIEWKGKPLINSYGNKMVIDYNGEPLFAELVVLNLFKEHGWNGVWVDSYRRKYRVGLPDIIEPIEIPNKQKELLDTIRNKTGKFGGCWDVFLWKDDQILFIELKRQKKDSIQDSQRKWLEHSLNHGLRPEDFVLLEWGI